MKRIDMWAIDMLFVVGGNGGNAGAAAIQRECDKAGVTCSIISAPKSIDNDILCERSSNLHQRAVLTGARQQHPSSSIYLLYLCIVECP